MSGIGFILAYEAVLMSDAGLSESVIGILLGVENLILIIAGVIGGKLAGNLGKKPLILFGLIVLSVDLIYLSFCNSILQFLIHGIFRSIAMPLVMNLMYSLTMSILEERGKGRGFGIYRAFGSFGFIFSTSFLTYLIGNLEWVARISGVTVLLCVFTVYLLPGKQNETIKPNAKDSIISNPGFIWFLVAYFLFSATNAAVYPFFAAYARAMGADTQLLGILSGFMGILALVSLPLMGWWVDRSSPQLFLILGFIAHGLRALLASFIIVPRFLWLPHLFHTFGWAGMEVSAILFTTKKVSPRKTAIAFSLVGGIAVFASTFSAPLFGYIAETKGYVLMFRIAFLLPIAGLIPLFLAFRSK